MSYVAVQGRHANILMEETVMDTETKMLKIQDRLQREKAEMTRHYISNLTESSQRSSCGRHVESHLLDSLQAWFPYSLVAQLQESVSIARSCISDEVLLS